MRRITYWLLSTVSVVVLLFGFDASNTSTNATPPTSVVSGASSGTSSGTSSTSGTRTVTGPVASTQWGPVQVQLTVSGGKITHVSVLQQPSGNSRDTEINDVALPILTRETLAQQSADIDMVSGATVTSGGYVQSLQSAIDQAGL